MGFSIITLAQKARTATLIADSDLNLGNYDLIATDVKGDTAEFDEFVGGVGNFTSGLIFGGLDVGGIMHAESTLQVDGNVILEGSINNVNINDNGEITTTRGVNAAYFNGVPIKSSGVITVTPKNNYFYSVPLHSYPTSSENAVLTLLPYKPNVFYNGSIGFKLSVSATTQGTLKYWKNSDAPLNLTINPNGEIVYLTIDNAPYLIVSANIETGVLLFGDFTLT